MSSILDDPKVREAVYPLSIEFYHHAGELGLIGDDVELLDGNLVKKMPKSPLHEWLVMLFFRQLEGVIPGSLVVRKEAPVTFLRSEPEPDIAVVQRMEDNYRHAHPATAELIIEVATSSLGVDRQKAKLYAAAGVKEYWIVIPESRTVEIYREPVAEGYRQMFSITGSVSAASSAISGFSVSLPEIFPL